MQEKIKCLVFDCDGVLLDSVPVKTRAFARLAAPYGKEAEDRFVMYHTRHGGVSRFKKFAWFFDQFLGREITPQESDEWGKKFAEYALEEVRACPMIPGALATLKAWQGIMTMYVCSGAPLSELDLILRERGLRSYFAGVFGSPPAKSELLKQIVRLHPELMPGEFLMIGDATTDEEAAKAAGTQFYAVGPELKGSNFPWSGDLVPLNDWLRTRHAAA